MIDNEDGSRRGPSQRIVPTGTDMAQDDLGLVSAMPSWLHSKLKKSESSGRMLNLKSICVFCGSNSGARGKYARVARELGIYLAEHAIQLVYGGGNVGLMGEIADAVMATGGEVVGVIPHSLAQKELAHESLTRMHIVDSMHERKAKMAELADAFVALPGGFGTLEEFCEVVTWCQLGIHRKPCVLLNIDGYFDPLLSQVERGVEEQFIRPEHREIILAANEIVDLEGVWDGFRPPKFEKWIGPAES